MIEDNFEIYYYSDIHSRVVESHTHDYYEFYLFLEGDIEIIVDGTAYPVVPGDLLIVPPGIPHHPRMLNDAVPYRRFVFWVSESYIDTLVKISVSYAWLLQEAASRKIYRHHLSTNDFNKIHYHILALLEETHGERYGKDASVINKVNNLLLELNRTIYEMEHPTLEDSGSDLLENLILYISSHLSESLDLESLASHFYVSKYHISHLFKDSLGISIHQYIQKKRLSAARDALLLGEKAVSVYADYGFNDYSSFFRAFKKEYGLSPKEYQEVYLKDPARIIRE